MRKGLSMAIDSTMKWVLALIVLLVLVMLVMFLRDRSVTMLLSTVQIPS